MSYANRGMTTELIIENVCNQYEDRGLAVIRKVPTPVKVLSNRNGRVSGFYEKKATVDFEGTISDGTSIAFDSKETKTPSLPFENIADHQLDYMKKVSALGGKAFLIVYFSRFDTYYRLDIKELVGYIEEPWETNKKSIPILFFETYAKELKSSNGLIIDFLEGMFK